MRPATPISRYRRICLVAGALVLLANTGVLGQVAPVNVDTVRARAVILQLESRWLAAHDSATLSRILAADFVHPVASGYFLDRSQHIAWVVNHPPDTTVDRRLSDMRVRFYGPTAVVTGMVIRSRDGSEIGRNVFTDVFVKREGRWQAVSAEETTVGRRDRKQPGSKAH
ncbi:MAG TPA: nuclear transport factor 2 family protein [Gemmatimonadaceae bacterium]|jgi:hypothetical protein